MPVEVYESCANQIDGELGAWIDELDDDFFQAMQESGEVDNVENCNRQ